MSTVGTLPVETGRVHDMASELDRTAVKESMLAKLRDLKTARERLAEQDKELRRQRDMWIVGLCELYGYRQAPLAEILAATDVKKSWLFKLRKEAREARKGT